MGGNRGKFGCKLLCMEPKAVHAFTCTTAVAEGLYSMKTFGLAVVKPERIQALIANLDFQHNESIHAFDALTELRKEGIRNG